MELRYSVFVYIGLAVVAVLLVFLFVKFKKQKGYKGGKKVVNTLIEDEPYFKKRQKLYKLYSGFIAAAMLVGIFGSFLMLARPIKIQRINKQQYNRDIMLCIDISTSVDYLNMKVIGELKDTVESLKGERFGILIFNTSSVLLTPLTDDYEFIIEQLDNVEKSLKMRNDYSNYGYLSDNWMYLNEYISAGTLVGNEERGSSLIGDGLATAVYDFTDLDQDRSRIIIFTTDNDLAGESIVTTTEACAIAKKNNVTVYGVGTKEMTDENLLEMKAGVESTGGSFFLEEESGSFKQIVEKINNESKTLLKGETEINKIERPFFPLLILILSISTMVVFMKVTKR